MPIGLGAIEPHAMEVEKAIAVRQRDVFCNNQGGDGNARFRWMRYAHYTPSDHPQLVVMFFAPVRNSELHRIVFT